MPKLTVIVPVYNVEKYLQDCIDSLMAQTLDDIEYIFVNDASPDNCLSILNDNKEKYKDKNIVIVDSKVNRYQGGARNIGIKMATANYIAFVDSDDMVMPNMFKAMYEEIIKENCDAVFIGNGEITDDQKYSEAGLIDRFKDFSVDIDNSILLLANKQLTNSDREKLLVSPFGSVWSGIYKKEIIINNQIWFPEKLKFEDNYWVSLTRCYFSKISVIKEVGYLYRKNPNSTVHIKNSFSYDDRITVEHMLLEDAKKRNLYTPYLMAWEYIFADRYIMNTFYCYVTRFSPIRFDEMQKLQKEIIEVFPNWEGNQYLSQSFKSKVKRSFFKRNVKSIFSLMFFTFYKLLYERGYM